MKLIIAEKPSVARDIAKVLGKGQATQDTHDRGAWHVAPDWVVTSALGHLFEFAAPDAYTDEWKAWKPDTLPMIPDRFKLVTTASGRERWKALKGWLSSANLVVNACDAGREGELIFRRVVSASRYKGIIQRLWLSEMTPTAIHHAFQQIKSGFDYDDLGDAAEARAEADWLVGMSLTRAVTLHAGQLLTIGRVQTPTLSLIVQRDEEIRNFVPEDYWTVDASWSTGGHTWTGRWGRWDADPKVDHPERILRADEATAILQEVQGHEGEIIKVESQHRKELPPKLYNLTQLQRDANSQLKWSAQHTLDVAQQLYEGQWLTYPRTDSTAVTDELAVSLTDRLQTAGGLSRDLDHWVSQALSHPGTSVKRVVNPAGITDHHAIIPTTRDPQGLHGDQAELYRLVAMTTALAIMADAEWDDTTVWTRCTTQMFQSVGHVLVVAGWRSLKAPDRTDDVLPPLSQGDRGAWVRGRVEAHQTKPPSRYSEASLLGAMAHIGKTLDDRVMQKLVSAGIGTSATRASIIETLVRRGYIAREGHQLVPTSDGYAVVKHAPDALKSAQLTADWEAQLMQIEQGTLTLHEFRRELDEWLTHLTQDILRQGIAPRSYGGTAKRKTSRSSGSRSRSSTRTPSSRASKSKAKRGTTTRSKRSS